MYPFAAGNRHRRGSSTGYVQGRGTSKASFLDAANRDATRDGTEWVVQGVVDSENGLGAELRTARRCEVEAGRNGEYAVPVAALEDWRDLREDDGDDDGHDDQHGAEQLPGS